MPLLLKMIKSVPQNEEINYFKLSKTKPAMCLHALFVAFGVFEKPRDSLLSEEEQGLRLSIEDWMDTGGCGEG